MAQTQIMWAILTESGAWVSGYGNKILLFESAKAAKQESVGKERLVRVRVSIEKIEKRR